MQEYLPKKNIIQEKSYSFALDIINLVKKVQLDKEYIISKQICRSGTSIGANVQEATGAHTKRDFIYKISIAYKEARETQYWLTLLKDSNYINQGEFDIINNKLIELLKILTAIQNTSKKV